VINAESIGRGVFRTPNITVTMKQCHMCRVTVVGAVDKPGPQDLPRGSTSLMAALLAAGGLTKEAGAEVEIRHTDSRQVSQVASQTSGQQTADPDATASLTSFEQAPGMKPSEIVKIDLTAAAASAVKVPDLRDGDVVHVAKRKLPPVYVIGLVHKPGEFPYPPSQQLRVLDALALAGGVSNSVAEDVLVIRHLPNAPEPVRIAVSLQAAKNGRDNLALAPGDTISVEQTPATIVVDTIQTFFRIGFSATMPWL
jgi:polysaccharide biosynthesis/export protein